MTDVIRLTRLNGDYCYMNPQTGARSGWLPWRADPIDDEAAQLSVDPNM